MAYTTLWLLWLIPTSAFSDSSVSSYKLNFSSPSPHIFSSTFALLQQWPNTFFPYGHTIAPCEIPVNTNLYHARIDGDLPPSPEWFAFDAEMSYAIAGRTDSSRMLTYKTTKAVKCIYFDGSSAALNGAGNMDTQMVFIHNSSANIPDEPVFGPRPPGNNNRTSGDPNGAFLGAEYDRAEALCDYIKHKNLGGRGWGFEGIVRMNAGFEMIWCDFESPSARLVSHLNTSVPLLDSQTGFSGSQSFMTKPASFIRKAQQALLPAERQLSKPPKTFLRNQPFQSSAALGWLTASVDRYGFVGGVPGRGEARVKLDSCGLFSFYDAGLTGQENSRINKEQRLLNLTSNGSWHAPDAESARKGALQSLMRRRRSHRADNVSVADGMYMHKAVEERLRAFASPGESGCSGIDWRLVAQEISLTYSANLHDILQLLQNVPANISTDTEQLLGWLSLVREMLHLLVMPYYEYPALATIRDSPDHAFGPNTDQARQAQRLCIGKHSPISLEDVTKTELFLYKATMEVTTAICHVVLTNFLSVEALWHGTTESSAVLTTRTATDIELTARNWRHSIEELTAWLGWADQWTTCKPGCSLGEFCWIPIWPVSFFARPGSGANRTHDGRGGRRPPGDGEGPPRRHPSDPDRSYEPGREYGPGHGYVPGHGGYQHRPPGGGGFGRNDEGLWEPRCVNRLQMLQDP